MKLQRMIGAAILMGFGILSAQEVQTFNTAADWNNNPAVSEADGVLTVKGRTFLLTSKKFKVDPAKTYTLALSTRAQNIQDKKDSSWVLAGFYAYDKNGKGIFCVHTFFYPGTFTEVVKDASKGAKSLLVKDGSMFRSNMAVVADAKEDLSDLPNFNIVVRQVAEAIKKDDVWELVLKTPLARKVKAGTFIRGHHWGGYLYTAGTKKVKSDWVQMSGSISGMSKSGYSSRIWPVGTEQAQIFIYSNWSGKKLETQFKDVTLSVK